MAGNKHLLLTVQGDYNDSALSAEGWQVGVRLALVFGSVDAVGTLPNNWDPQVASISVTGSNYTVTGNWNVDTGLNTFDPDSYLIDYAKPSFEAWMSGIPALWNKTRIRTMKLSAIGTNGRAVPPPPYATGTPCLLTYTSGYPVGLNSSDPLPPQITVVASHRTAQTGRTGRGRMFLPLCTESLTDTHGMISSSNATDIKTAQVALLEGLKYYAPAPAGAHVKPIVTGSGYINYAVINQVKVGNVFDTQRRRRRSIAETYVSGAVAP